MPKQKPHRSEQSVATPPELIRALEYRFGSLSWDLAAEARNTKCFNYITLEDGPDFPEVIRQDSLTVDWHKLTGSLWLNCEFGSVSQWARKCHEESLKGAKIFLLTPLTCAKWHCDWIFGKAYILQLATRLRFAGHKNCYPKDLQIAWFNSGIRGTEIWRWEETLKKHEQTATTGEVPARE